MDTHDHVKGFSGWLSTGVGTRQEQTQLNMHSRPEAQAIVARKRIYLTLKRWSDVVNALIQILLFSPIMLACALAIKLYDRGPVFFRQERVTGGRKGWRTFKIIKFRTMVIDAERLGAKITPKNDDRITPVGKVLRKFKFDEMPQLFNILLGEMTFVGPRPQTLGYAQKFRNHYEFIHRVVPAGLTDLATIKFRNEEELLSQTGNPEELYVEEIMPNKIECHEWYVRAINPFLDFWILFMTIMLVFFKR